MTRLPFSSRSVQARAAIPARKSPVNAGDTSVRPFITISLSISRWSPPFSAAQSNLLLIAFVSFSVLMLVVCWLFTTLQMLFLDMPLSGMLRNSLLILFGYAKRTLPAGLIVIGVMLCLLLFVPIPLLPLLLLLGLPALLAVVCDMWAWPVMEQAFHISEQQAARRAEREAQQ